MIITAAQCRAARGLVRLDQAELAHRAVISRNTVVEFEGERRTPGANNLTAIRTVLEAAGVIFVEENGEGPGVRLRKTAGTGDYPKPSGPATDAVDAMDAAINNDRGPAPKGKKRRPAE